MISLFHISKSANTETLLVGSGLHDTSKGLMPHISNLHCWLMGLRAVRAAPNLARLCKQSTCSVYSHVLPTPSPDSLMPARDAELPHPAQPSCPQSPQVRSHNPFMTCQVPKPDALHQHGIGNTTKVGLPSRLHRNNTLQFPPGTHM